jgi:RIO kinase 1
VRVPEPYIFSDGALVMEFITDADGYAAPRLGDADLSAEAAQGVFEALMQEVIRMLCAGVVHGDLSDFNVLLGERGPVVIDFPQALDAAGNRNARNILIRDVDNLHNFLGRATRGYRPRPFAQEMWALFERGELLPDTKLRGMYRPDTKQADVSGLLREIGDARKDAVRAGLARDEGDALAEADDDGERGGHARGDGARTDPGGRPPSPPRRRVEVIVNRGGGSVGRDGGARPERPQGGSRAAPPPQGPGLARPPRDQRPNGASGDKSDGGGRQRQRRGPSPDTQALLAAQPALTDAQRAKAAQIAEAARAAQAARAARSATPQSDGQRARGERKRGGAKGQGAGGGGSSTDGRRGQATDGGRRQSAKPNHTQGPPKGQPGGAPAAPAGSAAAADSSDAAPKRRRRRRRGRSGGAGTEPKA